MTDWDDGLINSPPKATGVCVLSPTQPESRSIDACFDDGIERLRDLFRTNPHLAKQAAQRVVLRIQDSIINVDPAKGSLNPFDEPLQETNIGVPMLRFVGTLPVQGMRETEIAESAVVPSKPVISSNPFDSFS